MSWDYDKLKAEFLNLDKNQQNIFEMLDMQSVLFIQKIKNAIRR